MSFNGEVISSLDIAEAISSSGYFCFHVSGDLTPRWSYTVGRSAGGKCDLVFAGGLIYGPRAVMRIIDRVVSSGIDRSGESIGIPGLGKFSLNPLHHTSPKDLTFWVEHYADGLDSRVMQLVPDAQHNTKEIPNLSESWQSMGSPGWRWLTETWDFDVPGNGLVTVDLGVLRGQPVRELVRWGDDSWEAFSGNPAEMRKRDMRVINVATLISLDWTNEVALRLSVGGGVWREGCETPWIDWE